MSLHTNHKLLLTTSASIFFCLSFLIAVMPAFQVAKISALAATDLPQHEISTGVERGREIYLKEGCAVCHTQFVRDLPVDAPYGRGSVLEDFIHEEPPLLGTQRTGPDLSNVGVRQPSEAWNLIHLYNPRAVVKSSVMPGYPWYFEIKNQKEEGDVVVTLPESFLPKSHRGKGSVVVAKQEAIDLVRYLQSLKQKEIAP